MTAAQNEIKPIPNWETFRQMVGPRPKDLLRRLKEFPDSALVTGCQRSGTTVLTRVLVESEGITNHCFGEDEELSGALILSGLVQYQAGGRHCFQTTYLNQNYTEYFDYAGLFKMIWVLRNPHSTVFSLINNWPARALRRTFAQAVLPTLGPLRRGMIKLRGLGSLSNIEMACHLYRWKIQQLIEIASRLSASDLLVVDYDELVLETRPALRQIYEFLGLPYREEYAQKIHGKSVNKKKELNRQEAEIIHNSCYPDYARAQRLITRR
jgi:hypothetical protein